MRSFSADLLGAVLLYAAIRGSAAFTVPDEGFALDIDGTSVSCGTHHICVLDQRQGVDIGGRAECWGFKQNDKTIAPQNVR